MADHAAALAQPASDWWAQLVSGAPTAIRAASPSHTGSAALSERGKKTQKTTQNTKQTTQICDSLIAFSVYRISAIISRNYFHCSKKARAESLSAASHAFPFACVVLSLPPTLENMHVRLSALSKFPSGVSVCVQGCLSFVLLCCSVTVWWKQNE